MKKFLFALLLAVAANTYPLPVSADEQRTVFVSILPQKYFVQQICMDRVQVEVMVQPGASPHTYEPKASQMTKLASTAVYFAVGDSFETAWLGKLAAVNPNMPIVHTDANIAKIPMATHGHDDGHEEAEKMQHAEGAGHSVQGSPDPHIWLSPTLVKQQVKTMLDTLVALYPDQAQFFTKNSEDFLRKIDELDAQLRAILEGSRGKQFMVFHPSWGYFARDYGLEQVPVEIEGKQPKPAQLKELVEHAREKDIRVIFAQPQFSTKSAQIIAREIGGEVSLADPLAEDWPTNLLTVAETIRRVVEK
jgi:zinc transport system substrate-binding protein